jgi:hypothetical protein
MKFRPAGVELFLEDGQTDRHEPKHVAETFNIEHLKNNFKAGGTYITIML